MVQSKFKSYDELPLFLNAKTVAEVLGISMAGAYELLHQEDFPVLRIGSQQIYLGFPVIAACQEHKQESDSHYGKIKAK